jgi:uncharacterized protein (TIGR00369 family)
VTTAPVWVPPATDDTDTWLAWANQLPLCQLLGLRCVQLDESSGTFAMPEVPMVANPNGSVNGGLIAAMADQAMGVMAMRGAKHGHRPATAALTVQFHSPAYAPLTLRAEVVGGGRRVRFVEVIVLDRDGNRCSSSHGTMVVNRHNDDGD